MSITCENTCEENQLVWLVPSTESPIGAPERIADGDLEPICRTIISCSELSPYQDDSLQMYCEDGEWRTIGVQVGNILYKRVSTLKVVIGCK